MTKALLHRLLAAVLSAALIADPIFAAGLQAPTKLLSCNSADSQLFTAQAFASDAKPVVHPILPKRSSNWSWRRWVRTQGIHRDNRKTEITINNLLIHNRGTSVIASDGKNAVLGHLQPTPANVDAYGTLNSLMELIQPPAHNERGQLTQDAGDSYKAGGYEFQDGYVRRALVHLHQKRSAFLISNDPAFLKSKTPMVEFVDEKTGEKSIGISEDFLKEMRSLMNEGGDSRLVAGWLFGIYLAHAATHKSSNVAHQSDWIKDEVIVVGEDVRAARAFLWHNKDPEQGLSRAGLIIRYVFEKRRAGRSELNSFRSGWLYGDNGAITKLVKKYNDYLKIEGQTNPDSFLYRDIQMDLVEGLLEGIACPEVRNAPIAPIPVEAVNLEGSYVPEDSRFFAEEERVGIELAHKIPRIHQKLVSEITRKTWPVLGLAEDEESLALIEKQVEQWQTGGLKHVIFVGGWESTGAQIFLNGLTKDADPNGYLRSHERPQVHFLTGGDAVGLERLKKAIGSESVEVVVLSPDKDRFAREAASAVARDLNCPQVAINSRESGSIPDRVAGLFVAGVVRTSAIHEIFAGAKAAHQHYLGMSPDDQIINPAYNLAQAQVRMARGGQNVSVPLIFSTTFGPYSVWLAQLFNTAVGTARLAYYASGERGTEHYHSTQQAWTQSVVVGRDSETEERAERGFMSLTFINPSSQAASAIGFLASHLYRGFAFDFVLRIAREALRLSLMLRGRPVVEVNFDTSSPEGLGQMIHFGQVASAMAGELAGSDSKRDAVHSLEDSAAGFLRRHAEAPPDVPADTLTRSQNILTLTIPPGELSDPKHIVMGGVLGEEMNRGDKELLIRALRVAQRLVGSAGLSKILEDYQTGQKLYHLNRAAVLKDMPITQGMAERFKSKKRVYAVQIGGSTSGEIMVDALGMTGGPQIIGVHSYDADQIEKMKADIGRNRDDVAIVVISKSGVTSETDANSWTLVEELADAFGEKDQLIHSSAQVRPEKTMQNVLLITDPQLGMLRTRAKQEGWLTLDHPVFIGGRFSMFSNVGLFYYFLKGGTPEALTHAMTMPELNWDGALSARLDEFKSLNKKVNIKKSIDILLYDLLHPQESDEEDCLLRARIILHDIYNLFGGVPGVWEGFLDNLINTAPGQFRDTEIAVALSNSYANFVSPKNPFYPQVRGESKSKPGVQFYASAVWGWNAIRNTWNRIIHNPNCYVMLAGEAAPLGADLSVVRAEQAAWAAMQDNLERNKIPYMASRTGPMSVASLAQFMWLQYLRLAVDTALYEPMEVSSEGQGGVQQTKAIFLAYATQIRSTITATLQEIIDLVIEILHQNEFLTDRAVPEADGGMAYPIKGLVPFQQALFTAESCVKIALLKNGRVSLPQAMEIHHAVVADFHARFQAESLIDSQVLADFVSRAVGAHLRSGSMRLPQVAPHEIERMTEVGMDLPSTLGVQPPLDRLIRYLLLGGPSQPGLATPATWQAVELSPRASIPARLANVLLACTEFSNAVRDVYIDGTHYEYPPRQIGLQEGYVIRATTLDNINNLRSNVSNGSRIGIYRLGENHPIASIQIVWGSGVRVIVSNGLQSQDYDLLPDGRLIEVDKSAEDNRIRMAPFGETLSLGARRDERPAGLRDFEEQVLWPSVDTKTRHSNSGIDYAYAMSDGGLSTGWLTWAEALEQAQIMKAAYGSVMVMTDKGMRHIQDVELPPDLIAGQEQVYVYAGNRDSVGQIQVFLDFLIAKNSAQQLVALDILKMLQDIPADAPAALRAQGLMLALHIERGLTTLPAAAMLKGEVQKTVQDIQGQIREVLSRLNVDQTMEQLRQNYLQLPIHEREGRAAEFTLLGRPEPTASVLRTFTEAGEATRLVYGLEEAFYRVTTWDLLDELRTQMSQSASLPSATLQSAMDELQTSYAQNIRVRSKPKEVPLPQTDMGESFGTYVQQSMGVPPIKGLSDEHRKAALGDAQQVYQRVVDVFTNDQTLDDVAVDSERGKLLATLRRFEPEIFYVDEKTGKEHMRSLRWMLKNIRERKTGAIVNPTGDVSSRLDDIFNRVLIYWTLPQVSLIISEEEREMVINGAKNKTDAPYRLVLMLDPIDGSSQIAKKGAFGLFVTLALLLPNQTIDQMNPRTQIIGGFDMQFGIQTGLNFLNRHTQQKGELEVAQFQLSHAQNPAGNSSKELAFRRFNSYGANDRPLLHIEEQLEWDGLLPRQDPKRALAFAMGGSMLSSRDDDGHREMIRSLLLRYPYFSAYTGFLDGDIWQMIERATNDSEAVAGMLHTYAATAKHSHGRFRQAFEEYYLAILVQAMGGEVIDGFQPMLDIHLPPEQPSEATRPFYAGSRWVTKGIMAWMHYVKGLPDKSNLSQEFDPFIARYVLQSRARIQRLVKYSQSIRRLKPRHDIHRALLDWEGDISHFIFDDDAVEATYKQLFPDDDVPVSAADHRWIPLEPLSAALLSSLGAFGSLFALTFEKSSHSLLTASLLTILFTLSALATPYFLALADATIKATGADWTRPSTWWTHTYSFSRAEGGRHFEQAPGAQRMADTFHDQVVKRETFFSPGISQFLGIFITVPLGTILKQLFGIQNRSRLLTASA